MHFCLNRHNRQVAKSPKPSPRSVSKSRTQGAGCSRTPSHSEEFVQRNQTTCTLVGQTCAIQQTSRLFWNPGYRQDSVECTLSSIGHLRAAPCQRLGSGASSHAYGRRSGHGDCRNLTVKQQPTVKHGNDLALITDDLARKAHLLLGADISIENPDSSFIWQLGLFDWGWGVYNDCRFSPCMLNDDITKPTHNRAWGIRLPSMQPICAWCPSKQSFSCGRF